MSVHEVMDITGRLTLRLRAPDGRVVDERASHNDITIHGRSLVARLFNNTVETAVPRVSRMCVGTSGEAFDAQKNALGASLACVPIAGVEETTVTEPSGTQRRRLRITGELTTGQGNGELREAGLFTPRNDRDPGAEVMYNRVTFPVINKTAEFQLTLVWDILF